MLKPQGDYGHFILDLDLSSNTTVDKVKATLWTLSSVKKDFKEWDSTALSTSRHIVYYYSGNDEDPSAVDPEDPDTQNIIKTGTYLLTLEFFADKDITPINQWDCYIKIAPTTLTQVEIPADFYFSDVYTIEMKDENGNDFVFTSPNNGLDDYDFITTKFTNRSSFKLPSYRPYDGSMDEKVFLGWKVGNTENIITSITQNTPANLSLSPGTPLTLTPYFAVPTLYVSETGDDSDLGFTNTRALETFTKAFEKIETYGKQNLDWTIKVNGTIKGGTNEHGFNSLGRKRIREKETVNVDATKKSTDKTQKTLNEPKEEEKDPELEALYNEYKAKYDEYIGQLEKIKSVFSKANDVAKRRTWKNVSETVKNYKTQLEKFRTECEMYTGKEIVASELESWVPVAPSLNAK